MTPSEWAGFLPREDSVLRECVIRIAGVGIQGLAHGLGSEITARQLVLRLSELLGGKAPKWHNDNGIFAPSAIKQIVEYIDARQRHPIFPIWRKSPPSPASPRATVQKSSDAQRD